MAAPGFSTIVSTEFRTIPDPTGPDRQIQNRNVLLWLYPGATGVKTGYTSKAGFCVVGTAERDGRRLVTVVLGAPGEPFSDAAALLDHGFAGFTEHTFVTAGEPHGVVTLAGGSVAVEAAGRIVALVPLDALDDVAERIVVDPRAAYPPAAGQEVARLKVTIPGLTVGTVPLVVSSVPPPPPIDVAPWWERAIGAVGRAVAAAVRAMGG
jgi:D-alanyl-D-alanine carboxypeptidase (penicillin-binding protein 5/6)